MKHLSIFLLGMFCFICNSIFADEIPNNEIWYEANAKLKQTTDYKSSGIYTNAFDVPIVSHTFANGKGVIQFNDEVKKIGFAAFMNCSELTSISVPNSVTEYGYWILNGCNKIRSIQISKSVKKIEAGAFSGCGGVGIINVESDNPNYDSRNNCNAIIETKSNTLLAGCKNTIIPNSVAAISSEAFYGCYDLKNITIPNSVKRIGYNAFYKCTSLPIIGSIRYADTNLIEVTDNTLSSYSIKEGTKFIGHQAFKDCINLTNISIPRSVIRIESGAFEGCSSLPVIDNIRYADKYLVEVTDNKLSSYTIQDGTLVVGSRAFEGCWNMTSISMPNSVEIIDEQAFSMCHSLSDVTFSTSLNTIGDDAFNGCDFNSLRIPNTVTNIGSRAFAQCFRLTDIYIPESVTKIGDGAFSMIESLSTIVVDPNNPIYDSRDNCNAIIETATNTIIAASTNTLIPKSVTAIGNEAYERRAELTSFTIPDNITVIGDRAFSECWNLEEVNIPNTVTSLGEGAFFYCSALKNIVIPNSVKGTLDETFCYCRELQSVTLSNGISYICGRAFTECNNLTDLYSNAIVPPTIEDDWAFRNVPSNMRIHVPAVSTDMYENAPNWKKHEIVPIQNKNTIQVNLPADAADGQYRNMTLELVDPNRNQTFRLIVKESRNYSFNNLEENTKYRLSLKTKNGVAIVEFEEINYTTGNLNIDIEKEKMKQLCVVNAKVLTPSNEDVTSLCTINWYDNNDDFVSQGQSVTEQIVGTKVKLSVALSKDLGVRYMFPAELLYDITSSDNTCTVNLEALPTTTLSGRVVDELTNSTLSNVTVTVSQTLNGKYSKLYSAKTDTNGKYRIQVYAVPSSISYVASDYITHTADIAEGFYNQEETVLETVKMKQITGTVITTNLTYRKCTVSSEDTEIENFYSDLNNVEYSIFNESTGKSITKFSVQYPKIVLLEEVSDGTVLQLTATSRTGAFMPVVATATIDAEQHANATFNIVELGKIKATFAKNANSSVAATLYDSKGKLVKTFDYSNGTLTINDLADGHYSLVTMGSSRLFNTIYDLAQLPQTGLVRLNDYVQHNVEVKSGEVTTIDIDEVPTLDESKLYYTGDNTSFTVNKSSIVAGNYLTLTGHLDFKSAYATSVSNVNLVVDLPESCQFVENSVMVGNATSSYTLDGHRITIPMVSYTDRVRFCIIPTLGGDYAPSALAQFDIDGVTVTQPIGSASYTAKGLSITVPSTVAKTTIPVSGTAVGASSVEIYDDDVLIGQTTSLANGLWSTTCELNNAYNISTHKIYAKVETKSGLMLQSEVQNCFYDKNAIEVKTVTMLNTAHTSANLRLYEYKTVIDFQNPSKEIPPYWYWPNYPDFTFLVDFTNNDPTAITNVKLDVLTSDNKIRTLYPKYNSTKDKYVVSEKFYSSSLPVNVSVDFSTHTPKEIDYDEIIKKMDELIVDTNILPDSLLQALSDSVFYYEHYDSIIDSSISYLEKQQKDNSYSISDSEMEELMNAKSEEEETEIIVKIVTNYIKKVGIPNVPIHTKDNVAYWNDVPISDCVRTVLTGTPWESDVVKKITKDLNLENNKFEVSNIDQERLVSDKTYRDGIIRSFDKIELVTDNMNLDDLILNYESHCPTVIIGTKDNHNNDKPEIVFCPAPPPPFCPDPSADGSTDYKLKEWAGRQDKFSSDWASILSQAGSVFGIAADVTKYVSNVKAINIFNVIKGQHEFCTLHQYLSLDKSLRTADVCGKWSLGLGIGSAVLSSISIGLDQWSKMDERQKWDYIIEHIDQGCLNSDTKDYLLEMAINSKQYIEDEYNTKSEKDGGLVLIGLGGTLAAFPLSLVAGLGALAGSAISTWSDGARIKNTNKENLLYIMSAVNSSNLCRPFPADFLTDLFFSNSNLKYVMDPSGFVYEGVFSNRLEGVTATAYYKEMVEDMYGDLHENVVKWNAAEYAQENPLFTDENGYYRWDVPQGMWQVKFEKEGYETTYSEWLPVPPPQLDVNIAMKQNVQPSVKTARAYPDAVEVEFDKYMMPELLTNDNIVVLVEGKPVSGSVTMLNEEASYEGSNEHYASKIRFNATAPFAADEVTLIVSNFVKSYAGIRMQDNYSQTFSIEPELCAIEVPENIGVGYGESTTLTITALPASAAAGKTMRVRTSSEMIASISDETVTLDMDGKAEITVFGELPGTAGITFTVDGYDFNATTIVGVTIPEKAIEVAAPKASLASGSVVEMGTTVTLSCDTPNATIYYTTDGSCPCDETTRLEYTAPIVIDQTMIIRAIAVATDLTESEIVEFTYTVVPAVGIDEVTLDETIKVFPLPVRDKLNVTAGGKMIKSVTLVSANGSVVAKAAKPETLVTLNVSTLAPGIYFINVATEDKKYSRKIMKVE